MKASDSGKGQIVQHGATPEDEKEVVAPAVLLTLHILRTLVHACLKFALDVAWRIPNLVYYDTAVKPYCRGHSKTIDTVDEGSNNQATQRDE